MMTNDEIFDFYDENWNDYNKVINMLHDVLDNHETQINDLKNKIITKVNDTSSIAELEKLKITLLECQDKLDEETHK